MKKPEDLLIDTEKSCSEMWKNLKARDLKNSSFLLKSRNFAMALGILSFKHYMVTQFHIEY